MRGAAGAGCGWCGARSVQGAAGGGAVGLGHGGSGARPVPVRPLRGAAGPRTPWVVS